MPTTQQLKQQLAIERGLYNERMEVRKLQEKVDFYKEKNKPEKKHSEGLKVAKKVWGEVSKQVGKAQKSVFEKDKRQGGGLF